tara:strand:- start:1190 stop:1546 length:357 start_codon:yes stop_codon:yes gene_type:complete
MAKDFKRFTVANCSTSTGASGSTVYTVPTGTKETVVIGITLANKSSSGITADVFIDNYTGSNDVYLVKGASIPVGSSLEVMSGNKVVLQSDGSAGDIIKVTSSASNALDAVVSVLEDV